MPVTRDHTKTFHTLSETVTMDLGAALGRRIEEGLCIVLVGSLGTGKSVLIRGICRGLGIGESVLSPTFILFEEYKGRLPVVHLDLYRLEHEGEVEELGAFDRIGDGSVVLVEWGDRSPRMLDASDVVIRLEMAGAAGRRITADYPGRLAGLFEGLDSVCAGKSATDREQGIER